MSLLKKRFRFTDLERLQAIQEVFNHVCEDRASNEDELWQNIHSVLCRDSPRFKFCSLRLLKDHMLEQIKKYKKYDMEEATESGKERLKTPWGEKMQRLMTVWPNYETLIEAEAVLKTKGRNANSIRKASDNETAKRIREAALGLLNIGNDENEYNKENREEQEGCCFTTTELFNSCFSGAIIETTEPEHCIVSPTISTNAGDETDTAPASTETVAGTSRRYTKPAKKCRNTASKEVWEYLAEKNKLEHELMLQKHNDDTELRREELAYKRAKLEFEQQKWKADMENRQHQNKLTETLVKVMEKFLDSDVSKLNKDK